MFWIEASISTRIGVAPPFSITDSTCPARRSAPSTPTGTPSVMPIRAISPSAPRRPIPRKVLNGPRSTVCPLGNKDVRTSSSVMTGILQSRDGEKRVIRNLSDAVRPGQSRLAPDLGRIATIAVLLHAIGEPPTFGHERLNRERGRLGDERDRGLAEIADASLDIEVGAADQRPRPPSGHTPHQSAGLRVELLHALVGLDDLRAADADASMLGYADAAAAGRDDAAAAKCPGSADNQRHDRDAGEARLDNAVDDLGDRQ